MEKRIKQNPINSYFNNSNNINKNFVFQTVKYIRNKEVKFDVNNKVFYYNLCDNFEGTQIKFVMERNLKELHFNFKEVYEVCGKPFPRVRELVKIHFKTNISRNDYIPNLEKGETFDKSSVMNSLSLGPLQGKSMTTILLRKNC